METLDLEKERQNHTPHQIHMTVAEFNMFANIMAACGEEIDITLDPAPDWRVCGF